MTQGNSGLSATTQLTWTNLGDMATAVDPRGAKTMMRYDAGRELVGLVGPDPDGAGPLHNRAARYTYGASGVNLGLVTRVDLGVVNSYLDADWSGITVLTQQLTSFDAADRPTRQSFVAGTGVQAVTQISYDNANRVTCTAVRMNSAVFGSLPSDACTQSTLSVFGPDRITSYGYDSADRVTTVTSAYASSAFVPGTQRTDVTNTWGLDSELLSQRDARGNLTTYVYDGFDRLSLVEPPNPASGGTSLTTAGTSTSTGYEKYTYDEASNILTDTRRDGQVISYAYDKLNNRTAASGSRTWAYDNFGRLVNTTAPSAPYTTYTYDALGRVTSEFNSALGAMQSGYDPVGNRTSLTYPPYPGGGSFVVGYKYDLTGAMTEVDDAGGNALVSYTYNDLGQRTAINRSNGVQTMLQYDYAQNPSSLQHSFSNTSNTVGETYHFTPSGQIFGHITSNSAYSWTSSSQPLITYGADGQNRYTSVGGAAYSYDGQGDLHSDGTNTYVYDIYGRLTSVTGGASATISYDGLSRLWATVGGAATLFLYDGARIAAEYDGGANLLRRYVPGAGPLETVLWYEGASVRWFLQDRRGSVMAAADGSQNLAARNTYDESGVPGASNAGRFQLNGLPWIPEAGLYLFGQRYYSPTLGRFLQPDPAGYADSLNLYRYAGGDPLNVWDPTGLGTLSYCGNGGPAPGGGDTDSDGYFVVAVQQRCVVFEYPDVVVDPSGGGGAGSSGSGSGSGGGGSGGSGAPQIVPPRPIPTDCQLARVEQGMVLAIPVTLSAFLGGGATGSGGVFVNLKTGSAGFFGSYGGGTGLELGGGIQAALYRSPADFYGRNSNINVSFPYVSTSANYATDGRLVGGGLGPGAKLGFSETDTKTVFFGCIANTPH